MSAADFFKAGLWFVGDDLLTGALHMMMMMMEVVVTTRAIRCAKLQLSPSPPSSLALIKSRTETFWHDTRLPGIPAFHVTQICIIHIYI